MATDDTEPELPLNWDPHNMAMALEDADFSYYDNALQRYEREQVAGPVILHNNYGRAAMLVGLVCYNGRKREPKLRYRLSTWRKRHGIWHLLTDCPLPPEGLAALHMALEDGTLDPAEESYRAQKLAWDQRQLEWDHRKR